MSAEYNLPIDKKVLDTLQEAINASILAALGADKTKFIEKLVDQALNAKVETGYGYDKKTEKFIDFTVRTLIQEAAKSAVYQFVSENGDVIRQRVKELLITQESVIDKFANAVIDAMTEGLNFDIKVVLKERTES